MMNTEQYALWSTGPTGLSDDGLAVVRRVRVSEPSRMSLGYTANVRGRYPSIKMGHTVGFDSHTCELTWIYLAEHDPKILEYWEQPPPRKISWVDSDGKNQGFLYTADFVELRANGVEFIQCKPESLLVEAARKDPKRYVKEDGRWKYPAADAAFAPLGIKHSIWTPEQHQILGRNLKFFQGYHRAVDLPEIPSAVRDRIVNVLSQKRRVRLDQIQGETSASGDQINQMILAGEIYVNLEKEVLASPHAVWVYPDREQYTALNLAFDTIQTAHIVGPIPPGDTPGSVIVVEGKRLILKLVTPLTVYLEDGGRMLEFKREEYDRLVNEGKIQGTPDASREQRIVEVQSKILATSPDEIVEANKRYKSAIGTEPFRSKRSQSRWRRLIRFMEDQQTNSPVVALLANHSKKGNRTKRLEPKVYELADHVVEHAYRTATAPSKLSAHARLFKLCQEAKIEPPSYVWLCSYIDTLDQRLLVRAREGRRSQYSKFGDDCVLVRECPPHGDHPWDVGHIDHTLSDVFVRCPFTDDSVRPWLTSFCLSYCRMTVAHVLHFSSPSSVSVLSVLRVCLKKYGRLPDNIVMDGGKEFQSGDIQRLFARMRVTVKYRPPHRARHGSVLESSYHALNMQLLHNLEGNTKLNKNVRRITKSVDPSKLAKLGFGELDDKIAKYYSEVAEVEHPAFYKTPNQAYADGLQLMGERAHTVTPYDEELHILTMPTTLKGTCKVYQQGVKHAYFWYANSALLKHLGEDVPVRYDTDDFSHVYAFVENKWIECVSNLRADLLNRTAEQMKLASEAARAALPSLQARRKANIAARVINLLHTLPAVKTQENRDQQIKKTTVSDQPKVENTIAEPVPRVPKAQTLADLQGLDELETGKL